MKPERRTGVDLAVTAVIVIAVIVAGLLVWNFSSAAKAQNETVPAPSNVSPVLIELPGTLRSTWRARADRPVQSLAGTAVLALGGEITGHDPVTGERTWRYQRDTDACALTTNSGLVLAYYRDARGCGEITALDPLTGERRYSRSGRADHDVTVTGDGNYAITQGATRVDVFRSDLVTTVQYGKPDVPVNPGVQPRSGCTIGSALPASANIVILESCPTEPNPRLTVIGASPKESSEPQETSSVVAAELGSATPQPNGDRARLIAATSSGAVVYVPAQDGRPARVVTVNPQGRALDNITVTTPPDGAPKDVPVVTEAGIASFFTGTSTVVIDTPTLRPTMVIPATLGPGVVIGGQLVVPGRETFSAYSLRDQQRTTEARVARPGYTDGPVLLTLVGETIVAQWGDTIQAYQP